MSGGIGSMKMRIATIIAVCVAAMALVLSASAQTGESLNSSIESLRADLRADKIAIVGEAMQLSEKDSAPFWRVFRDYEQENTTLNDGLVQIVKTYAEKFGNITNADAETLINKSLDLQSQRIELKRKYMPVFSKATSSLTAAKFFQLEYRLELLFNLKLASELPALLIQPAPKSAAAKQGQ
jgi:hypothetical protein